MKLTTLILLLTTMLVSASTYSQNTRLTLQFEEITFEELFQQIEKQTEFRFAYSKSNLDPQKKVNIDVSNETLEVILEKTLSKDHLSYQIIDRYVIITDVANGRIKVNSQQQETITGKVTNETGDSLPGVTIVVKGTTIGTTTNADGEYTLEIPANAEVLLFSFVGMETQEVTVAGQTVINVTLASISIGIDEVVAIGYGTMRKSDLTGAIITVDTKTLSSKLNTNILQSLQGSAAGLNVTTTNFTPGEDPSFQIRGVNSLATSSKPLIVLDGIPYEGDLVSINPSDVQSVSVLKDASSSAIYGARAANGVILITTKKGTGRTHVNFESSVGISTMANKIKMLDGEGYEAMLIDYRYRMDLDNDPNAVRRDIRDILESGVIPQWESGTTVDWQDLVHRTALLQNYNLSLSGSNEKWSYYTSLGYLDEEGILDKTEFKRISLRTNMEHKLNDWFKLGINSQLTQNDRGDDIAPSRGGLLRYSPYGQLRDENGNYTRYPQYPETYVINPYANEGATQERIKTTIIANFFTEITPSFLPGLSYRLNFGNYISSSDYGSYYPSYTISGFADSGVANISHGRSNRWTFENIIKYDKKIGEHSINLTGLYSREKYKTQNASSQGKGFINDESLWHQMGAAEVTTVSSGLEEQSFESYMGRLNYAYGNKYNFTATIRRDGYSGFGINQKYGNFPSLAFGWTLSNEGFFKNSTALSTFNFLKLRLSWGANGNMAISPYQTLDRFKTKRYVYDDDGVSYIGLITKEDGRGNPNLRWESFESYNFAVDFSLLKNRISGTIDYFTGKSKDLLMERSIPIMNGTKSVIANIGETENNGFEVVLNTVNIETSDFKWSTNINYQMTRNKITKLRGDSDGDGIEDDDISNEWFIGEPISAYYGYVMTGIFKEGDDFSIQPEESPGNPILMDLDNSGHINSLDRKVLGSRLPKWSAGIANQLSYKNWELSIFIYTVQGITKVNELVNPDKWAPGKNSNYPDIDFWTTDNQNAAYMAPSYEDLKGTKIKIYEDASFVKIQDVSLTYNVPKAALSKLKINNLSLYVKANNLYTFTDWFGYDPENVRSQQGNYPSARTFVFGFKIGL